MAKTSDTRSLSFSLRFDLKKEDQGFTLIEMLVSISILTVIMAAMFSFLWGASKHWSTAQNAAEVTENARLGLNRMTRELKQATEVSIAETHRLSFKVNFGTGEETITYGFTLGDTGHPGSIWRSTSTAPGQQVTLVNDVQNDGLIPLFTYYGNDYKCDTDPDGIVFWSELQACSASPASKIARVDISLTLATGSENGQTFVEQAWLRNRVTTS